MNGGEAASSEDLRPPEWDQAVEQLSLRVALAAEVTLDLTGRPALRRIRSTVAACLGFGRHEPLGAPLLVVDELVGNAYRHTARPSGLRVTRERRGMLVEVADDDAAIGRVSVGGGHGLKLVGRLSVHWGVRAAAPGKVVWALVPGYLFREA
ncbi:ATP-binding protein [Amycolatopsis sp. NPDC051128]|uniref:ATP-binding protein n=1 Tax=Amycolatopsis sp. NPDC051128 TaxID=3155412 RepID=UPI003446D3A3